MNVKNEFKLNLFFCFCFAIEIYYHVFILLNINMSIEAAKIIKKESFKDNIFCNRDVNRGSLVTSCLSSGFFPA